MNANGGARQLLLHGLVLILSGLLWGLVVPSTPYPRLALGAHIQFMVNGMLFAALATMLIALPNAVGPRSLRVMVVAAWLTWAMALSEVAMHGGARRRCCPSQRGRQVRRAANRCRN